MHYKIDIPEPCHENWQEMTPTEKGKFCAHCEKEVVDFSGLSKYEITQKIKHNKNLCGRFQQNQLDQEYVVSKQNNLSRLGLVFGIGSLLAMVQPAQAQTERVKTTSVFHQNEKQANDFSKIVTANDSIVLSGVVFSKEKKPLSKVFIIQASTQNATTSDQSGEFELLVSKKDLEQNPYLIFSSFGYTSQTITIRKQHLRVILEPESDSCLNKNNGKFLIGKVAVKGVEIKTISN